MRPDGFITKLLEARVKAAVDAIETPPNPPDLFNYGRAVGVAQGLALAQQVYEELLADAEDKGKRF